MEHKTCNKCGKSKPINLFHKLRKDKEWRRSVCAKCHNKKTKINRDIRNSTLVLIFLLLSVSGLSQSIETMRSSIIDSINYYRQNPILVEEAYNIDIRDVLYPSTHEYIEDKKISKGAQKYAEKMARSLNYSHSTTLMAESIDASQNWEGGYKATVMRFIMDEGVPNRGHRRHLLRGKDKYIGVGVAVSKKTGETYVCIRTL